MSRVAVVGGGVVGLSTAVCLQETLPNLRITVVADKFSPATTSDGAAGIFRPTPAKTPNTDVQKLRQWCSVSAARMHEILISNEASDAGVSLVSGYFTHDEYKPWPLYAEFAYQFRDLSPDELQKLPGPRRRYGWFASLITCECSRYLPFLTARFEKGGGKIIKKKLSSIEELAGDYDVVVNCAGYGNKALLGDTKLFPNRGHVIRLRAPWVKHFLYYGENNFIIPGIDVVSIGTTRDNGREDTQPTAEDHKRIYEQSCEMLPSLQNARVLWDWVGLRPMRTPLRLELEQRNLPGGGQLQVVHNYGHGGEGVTLSWGTAVEACQLVIQALGQTPGQTQFTSKL